MRSASERLTGASGGGAASGASGGGGASGTSGSGANNGNGGGASGGGGHAAPDARAVTAALLAARARLAALYEVL